MGSSDQPDRIPTREIFAEEMLRRIRDAGEDREVAFDRGEFALVVPGEQTFHLNNAFEAYEAAKEENQEVAFSAFVRTWFAYRQELPDDFADASYDLMPAVRSRCFFDFNLKRFELGGHDASPWPYQVIGEHLGIGLVYDLPHSMRFITQDNLDHWGVSNSEALEVATENLRQTTKEYAEVDNMRMFVSGDTYDATRLILSDLISRFDLNGCPIAMIPNREVLVVAGSNDHQGLATMLEIAKSGIKHERYITGHAFALGTDGWQPWLPATDHPSFNGFHRLSVMSRSQDYNEQKELLEAELEDVGRDVFVSSLLARQHQDTDEVTSFTSWVGGIEAMLPKAEEVMFVDPENDNNTVCGSWSDVRHLAGDLMKRVDVYPERYLVRELPPSEMLAKLALRPIR